MAEFVLVPAASTGATWALTQYFEELARTFPEGFDIEAAWEEGTDAFDPPKGAFVLAGPLATPTACGGIRFLDEERGEIKRMWVEPASRGQGIARALLDCLEGLIKDAGRSQVVLDTNKSLPGAVALYESSGYQPIPRYSDNPYAHHWFAKALADS